MSIVGSALLSIGRAGGPVTFAVEESGICRERDRRRDVMGLKPRQRVHNHFQSSFVR
jgi:hypothetical protein